MHQLNKKQIGSHGTKECKISSGKCVHTFQKVFENTREDAIALANSTLVSALQTLGQTTICCQSNAYFTLPMCKLIRANNMFEHKRDVFWSYFECCAWLLKLRAAKHHYITLHLKVLWNFGPNGAEQPKTARGAAGGGGGSISCAKMEIEGYEISITTYHMSTKLTLKRVVIWSSHSSLESKRYARWLKWGASCTSSVVCCVPGQLIWINGVSWGCALTWRHVAWVGTTSNLKQGSLSLTRQK